MYENVNFPGWEVVRKIGEGSFGGVYEIHRTLPGGRVEKCALKKLSVPRNDGEIQELISQSFSTESITAHYKNQMGELVNEYSLTQELSSCKNVVGCYDVRFIQHDDGIGWDIYIRMELLNPLRQALSAEYQEATVLRLGLDMCNALLACQEHSIIHRDIKPENILVSDRGEFKLGDFGIAKVSERTGTGTMTGTMGYMAPEVANRQHYGPQADIYSLGMVLYWMMNRRTLPFLPLPPSIPTGAQRQQAQDRRLSGEPLPPPIDGSEALRKIVLKACAFSPAERYRSAEEMQAALQSCMSTPAAPRMQRQKPMAPPAPISEPTVIDTPTELEREPAVHANAPRQAQQIPEQQGRQQMAEKQTPEKEAPKKDAPPKKQKKPVIYHVMVSLIAVALILACCGIGVVIFSYAERRAEAAKTEQAYQAALVLMEEGNYSDAADAFAALGDYGDSAEKAQEAGRLLEQSRKEQSYQDAQALMDGRDYSAAAEAFEALGDYADSASKVQEAHRLQAMEADYQAAQALMDDGKYMQAMWAFKALDYLDSQEKTQEARDCFIASQRTSLSAGNFCTLGLRNDSAVVITASNGGGFHGETNWRDIVEISAGGGHNAGLRSDGTVVAAGSNDYGQCDVSSWTDIVAVSAGWEHTVGLHSDGTVVATGRNENGECDTDSWTDIVAVSTGNMRTVGLRADGTVVTTGSNDYYGECDTDSWTDIVAVSAGGARTVGLRADGTVVTTGSIDYYGECDTDSWTDIVAVSTGYLHTVGLRSDGTVVATGLNGCGECDTDSWTDIVAVSTGIMYTVGLRSDGTVVATGSNDCGQCDVSSWTNIATGQQILSGSEDPQAPNSGSSDSPQAAIVGTLQPHPTGENFSQLRYAVFDSGIGRDEVRKITFMGSRNLAPLFAWDVSEERDGSVVAWVEGDSGSYDLYIAANGRIRATYCSELFAFYYNVEEINFNGVLDTSQATDMFRMFQYCNKLTGLDLSSFDTSCVTDMVEMFDSCGGLSNLDLSSFDTSHVTNMVGMFRGCQSLTDLDLSSFDFANVQYYGDFMDEGRTYNGKPWEALFS